jgi:hypothetical protein
MTKTVLIASSTAMISLGLAIHVSGHRIRKSLDVPLLSNHDKLFLGSAVAFFGVVMLSVVLMYVR